MNVARRYEKKTPLRLSGGNGRLKLHEAPLQERLMEANRVGVVCAISDVIMVSLVDSFIHQAHRYAREHGLMRFRLKSLLNELTEASRVMLIRSKQLDTEVFMEIMFSVFPFARRRFIEDGGGVKDEFVSVFERKSGSVASRIHAELLRMTSTDVKQHPQLAAHLLAVNIFANMGLQVRDIYAAKQNAILAGDVAISRQSSLHYEKYVRLSSLAMKEIGFSMEREVPDEDYEGVRKLHEEMAEHFSVGSMVEMCAEIAFKSCMTYIEYAVACLRVDLEKPGRVDEAYLKPIVSLIGRRDTGYLTRFLRRLPMPEAQGVDIWEYAQQLPMAGRSKTLDRLRRKTMAILNQNMNEPIK